MLDVTCEHHSLAWCGGQVGRFLGKCAPCATCVLREQHHLGQQPLTWRTHHNATPTRAWRLLPIEHLRAKGACPPPTSNRHRPILLQTETDHVVQDAEKYQGGDDSGEDEANKTEIEAQEERQQHSNK